MKRVAMILLVLLSFPGFAQGSVPITAVTAAEVMGLMAVGPGRAYDVAFAPNGKLIAVASSKGVKLYETGAFGAGDLLDRENGRSVVRLAIAPDAQTIVALDPGYNVKMFDTNTGEAIFDEYPDDLGGSLTAVAVSPDLTTYAIGASDLLDLYDFETHEQLFQLSGHAHIITAIDYSPDREHIATSSWDTSVKIWHTADGTEARTLLGHSDGVLSVDYNTDGDRLVTSSADGTVRLWDPISGEELSILVQGEVPYQAAVFHPDGTSVAVGDQDGRVLLIDVETGAVRAELSDSGQAIVKLAFSPDGALLVAARPGQVQLWDLESMSEIGAARFEEAFRAVALNADGSLGAAGGAGGVTYVWETAAGALTAEFEAGDAPVTGLAFTLESPTLYIGSQNSDIFEMDLGTGEEVGFLEGTGPLTDMTSHPTLSMINAAMADGALRWWSTETGEIFGTSYDSHNSTLTATAFSPDGRWMASADAGGAIHIWDVASGNYLFTLEGAGAAVNDLAFSHDGEMLTAALEDARVGIWRLDDPTRPVLELGGFFDSVRAVEFSPDDTLIATGGFDDTVRLFDTFTGEMYNNLYGHNEDIYDLAFSPDGTRLYSAGADGQVIVWFVP